MGINTGLKNIPHKCSFDALAAAPFRSEINDPVSCFASLEDISFGMIIGIALSVLTAEIIAFAGLLFDLPKKFL